jgi:hypothetical protein
VLTRTVVVLAICAALLGGAVSTESAKASASNCPAFPAFWDYILGVPAGNYCVIVFGKGLTVTEVYGTFTNLVHPVCNWTITAEFFDTNWAWYKTSESKVQKGCSRHSATSLKGNYTAKPGHLCSTLRSNGTRLTSYCFSVHRSREGAVTIEPESSTSG